MASPNSLPDQTGKSGQVLSTDGNALQWVQPQGAAGGARGDQIIIGTYQTTGALASPYLSVRSFWIPPDVTRVRVTMANRSSWDGTQEPAAATTLAVGTPVAGLNAWAMAPTLVNLTVDGNGVQTGWLPVTPNAAGFIMVAYYLPAGVAFAFDDNNDTDGFQNTNSNDVVNLPGLVAATGSAFQIAVEFETAKPRLVLIGDGTIRGLGSSANGAAGFGQSFSQIGPLRGIPTCCAGIGTMRLLWFNPSQVNNEYSFYDMFRISGARALIMAGVEDILQGFTPEQMRDSLYWAVTNVRSAGATEVWVGTLAPINQANTTLDCFNAFVRAMPFGIDYAFDVNTVLRDPANHTNLLAAYDADPVNHKYWTAAAYTALINQLVTDGKI